MSDSLEHEVEECWFSLIRAYKPRTIYLTCGHRLVWGQKAEQVDRLWEVGTYTKGIELEDFRADVFHVFDQRGRK